MLNLKGNYQKFKIHFKSGGVLCAIRRGLMYFIFLIKRHRERKECLRNIISKGMIKLVCTGRGIKIYWNELEVTQAAGLNSAINTFGLWTDSSFADWQMLQKGSDYFKLRVIFKNLPLSQTWRIKIENEQKITWQIEMDIEEILHIDEVRLVSLVSVDYKTWINNYQQGDFPCLSSTWRNIPVDNTHSCLVGVRFPKQGIPLPSLLLEINRIWPGRLYPIFQNPPLNTGGHIIGFSSVNSGEKRDYPPGYYNLFCAEINLFSNDRLLDEKIERLRQDLLETTISAQNKLTQKAKARQKLSILLVNLPWQKEGKWGVRAGSRWPHIRDKSEGRYLPFPFFLAYAASLLQRYDIETRIIDAIAEQIPEDIFIGKILSMDFDYLVAETSIPSFYDDLRILAELSKQGIRIILCGPNAEIYKPDFLRQHSFIDFVLYREYEFSLLELIKRLQENRDLSGVKGLIYRTENEIIRNPEHPSFDINLLPWPEREQLPMDKYWDLPGNIPYPSVQMIASRGCPFGCNFCLWPQVMYRGSDYRARDITDVVNEMEYMVKTKGFKSVYFDDDTFNIDRKRMLRLSQAIKEKGLQGIPWAIMARPDLMDAEILNEMKSAGLWAVKYGVESKSEKLLGNYQKNMNFQKADRIIKMTKSLSLKVHLTFSFGILGETKDTIKQSIDYALSLEPSSVQFSILTPFPGTRLFEELDKQGRILTKDWSKYDGHCDCVFRPDNLTPQDLQEAKGRAYRLWGEYVRKKRGFLGDVKRFIEYLKKYGFRFTFFAVLGKYFIQRDRPS